MTHQPRHMLRSLFGASVLALTIAAGASAAETVFTATNDGFAGAVSGAAAERGRPVTAGSKAVISGQRLIPGQEITLMRGTTVLNTDGPLVVDGEGKFSFELTIDAEAATGLQPILVVAEKPAAATVLDLKISPDLPIAGTEKFAIESKPVSPGLYQVAYSAKNDALFVAAAVGRPPVKVSQLSKVAPASLEVTAHVAPAAAPARPDGSDGGVLAVYGVAVDDANGTVWTTNTRQNTVAVYKQDDLSLVKQFEPGSVSHSRDVVIDEANGRAYVTAARSPEIEVFDTKTLEQLDSITVPSEKRGETFTTMSLTLVGGKLFTVSMGTNEAAVIDVASGDIRVFALPGALAASGVAYDAQEDLLFVASQQSDNLLIVKAESGEVLHDVETGAGALNVTFEPESRLAFVANRGSGTITVVDTKGEVVANLDAGSFPNQMIADGKGTVWAVNKSRGENDESGDRIWKIAPAK